MRKIIFISQLPSAEFAKRKIYDYSNKESKRVNIPELKQRLKEVKESYAKKSLTVREQGLLKHKKNLNQITISGMRFNSRAFPKVDPLKEPIADRLRSYKFNKEKNKEFAEVDNWLKNRSKNKEIKVISSQSSTKIPLLQSKSSRKGLLVGAGAAGLLTVGAIGYGVYRKLRSDKGRKRGRYAK